MSVSSRVFVSSAAVLSVVLLLTSSVPSADDVAATAHNLTNDAGLTVDALCEPCHTPHMDPTASGSPLWNHTASVASWDTRPNQTQLAGSSSEACLSCHDGTVGLDNYYGGTNEGSNTGNLMGDIFAGTTADLGTDLTRQHPVGVVYPAIGAATADYNANTDVTAATLNLDNDEVHCNSCHNPHTTDTSMLILQNDANSTLCKTCHIK